MPFLPKCRPLIRLRPYYRHQAGHPLPCFCGKPLLNLPASESFQSCARQLAAQQLASPSLRKSGSQTISTSRTIRA